jgi:hypothetical protein
MFFFGRFYDPDKLTYRNNRCGSQISYTDFLLSNYSASPALCAVTLFQFGYRAKVHVINYTPRRPIKIEITKRARNSKMADSPPTEIPSISVEKLRSGASYGNFVDFEKALNDYEAQHLCCCVRKASKAVRQHLLMNN